METEKAASKQCQLCGYVSRGGSVSEADAMHSQHFEYRHKFTIIFR